jgi:hypothetical protein
MLILLTWSAVASAFRYFLPPSAVGRETATMLAVFVLLALVVTVMVRARKDVLRQSGLANAT